MSSLTLHSEVLQLDKSPKLWVGRVVAQFRVTGLLGCGSNAAVFRAHDRLLQREVALKILPRVMPRESAKQMIREARNVAGLSHPGIVTLYEVGRFSEWYFIAMELVDGGSVARHREEAPHGRLPADLACRWIAQAAAACAHAHARGLLHCDIKPANLLLTPGGQCKIADFGLARALVDASTFSDDEPAGFVGSPHYVSPEAAQGFRLDGAADVYSLGATLWHLLTGQPPFCGHSVRELLAHHVKSRLPDIRASEPTLPRGLCELLCRTLTKSPADRPTAEELGATLQQYSSPMPPLDTTATTASSSPFVAHLSATTSGHAHRPAHRQLPWVSVVGAVALLLLVAVGFWLRPRWTSAPAAAPTEPPLPVSVEPSVAYFTAQDAAPLLRIAESKDERSYTVRGTVATVTLSRTARSARMEFSPAQTDSGFYVVIQGAALSELLDRHGEDLQSPLVGRSVQVHGVLRVFQNRPRIFVRELKQLQIDR